MPAPERTLHPAIPRVTCPRCGSLMRLAQIGPAFADDGETETFDCTCGFTYNHTIRQARGSGHSDPANAA